MNQFRVWIRLLGPRYRIRVDGAQNAQWLLNRLKQSSMIRSGEPLLERTGSSICNFSVPCTPGMSSAQFETMLTAIPEVQLMTEPE